MIIFFLILTLITSQTVNAEEIYEVYVKQSEDDTNTGTAIGQERKTLKSAYDLLGNNQGCKIYVVDDAAALKVQAITFNQNQGITIEGISSDGNGNAMVSIDCDARPNEHLFQCSCDTEFKYLAFNLPLTLKKENESDPLVFSVFIGYYCNLTIKTCQFIRPITNQGTVDYDLVGMSGGNLFMDSVDYHESTFTVGDGGVTSFISCSSHGSNAKSGGIYLYMPTIASASHLKWPTDGTNLVFQDCSSECNGMKRNTGIYIYMKNNALFKDMADAMRDSFATNYTRADNRWFVVGDGFDFVSSYFDPPEPDNLSTAFVKNGGKGNGINVESATGSINDAYDHLNKNGVCKIDIIKTVDPIKAEAISFDVERGITIEGVKENGEGNTEVVIDCDVNPGGNLFACNGDTEFKYLAFYFPFSLNGTSNDALIFGYYCNLTISNCQFIRPPSTNEEKVDYKLVNMNSGNFVMDSVECVDDSQTIAISNEVFSAEYSTTVSLTNVTLKKISSDYSIVSIRTVSSNYKMDVTVNNCTFTECEAGEYGTLFVSNNNSKSTFTVGDGGVTSFSSCTGGQSGGIYLEMPNIQSASQLKWPTNGKNLVFQDCFCGEEESKRNTGLYISLKNDSLFKDIADSIKESFADDFTREDNLWNVVGHDNNKHKEYDFTSLYFDPPPPKPDNMTRAFVKNGGKGNGINVNSAMNSIFDAYDFLEKRGKCFIDIIKTADPVKAEGIIFSANYGITIEGVNDNGEGNTEVSIDCDVSVSSILFSCQRVVEFKYLAFQFSSTEKNWDSLIGAGYDSTSLKISTCRFARIGSQSQEGMNSNADGNSPLASSLVRVTSGTVEMDTVKCTDETSFVAFFSSPFSFSGANEVSLIGMDINKVNVESGAAISINDGINSSSKVSIEGLNMNEVKSEKGAAAGLDITLSSEESRVAIGRGNKCSFKSCSAPEGKSGAIFIDMPKATSNLQLPSANNLEIDSSNTAGSKTTSLFIIAPDFEEFCKQEDAFAFANDFDDSTVGWIEGAKDAESEPEDVYEKYVKVRQEKLKDQNKKNKTGIIVAIVVPIVVVVAAVVVVVIVVVVVKKRKSRNEENDEKEQEMKD
ncbi:uncharacterized protein MONOS_10082 [Monocercomonoides exilis]|uniref:uncharacterized protein n=1 Tax=Monocercomonoides exilis TaxID=2049356 RepID=UPI00355AA6F3|nr:hypothetical protein MONOS_10082 [Monocercomonoides exilis]|eukprot:MONOS_10082.1-p1 / transcript=MONOS_10082.1 / gene=MONOS_10082 / organism=Monocercomonoides_exilis_PA203 / gene_product=unspecified product / transcript_product=unspecified product / location=Mono_scaffold00442:31894-35409(+) / protein_length=1097 / sequence_SO=supercontig / SO=protein_coding / is_pseudo=false